MSTSGKAKSLYAFLGACCLALVSGCGVQPSEPIGDNPIGGPVFTTNEVSLAAGMSELQPVSTDTLSGTVDLARFGATAFDRVYELETPANTEFSFTFVARGFANFGATQISLGHVADAGVVPDKGAESLVMAGMNIEGTGLNYSGDYINVIGDGFARMTVSGRIQAEQVLIANVPRDGQTPLRCGVRVAIGSSSVINLPNVIAPPDNPTITSTDIYSSDSWYFGLPAIAVSGDRVSFVAYDGDAATDPYGNRLRRWLQYDSSTGQVSGGQATCASPDAGSWRDQEIAALGNVLAVVYSGNGEVRTDISLDRGASFPIQQVLHQTAGWGAQRLVQIAIGQDYRVGCLYWSCEYDYYTYVAHNTLTLIEGLPTGFDSNNTPAGYAWGAPKVISAPAGDITPLLMHLEYSTGGDLVIGYGYTLMELVGMNMVTSARFRCAVRLNGQTGFNDGELDHEDAVRPADPHISLIGSGSTMQIFYAYEKTDGIHLLYSSNAGSSWQQGATVAIAGAVQPSVLARDVGGNTRVDLLYLSPVSYGADLHDMHWDNFTPGSAGVAYRITETTATPGGTPPPGCPQGMIVRTVGMFGYDAVLKDDKVAIAVHEITADTYAWWGQWGGPMAGGGFVGALGPQSGSANTGAPTPPPAVLLPGMTGSVPAPNASQRNMLSLKVID